MWNMPFQKSPLQDLWPELAALDIADVALRSGAVRVDDKLEIASSGQNFIIDIKSREIINAQSKKAPSPLWQLLLTQYLLKAQDIPLEDKLMDPREFVGGEFFFRGPHAFKLGPLEAKFGADKGLFCQTGISLGGQLLALADAAFTLPVLPRIPLTYLLWCADADFPARINVLFDKSAKRHLPLDMLWNLVELTSKELLK